MTQRTIGWLAESWPSESSTENGDGDLDDCDDCQVKILDDGVTYTD